MFKMIVSLNTTRQKPHWFQAKGILISYIDHYKSKNSLHAKMQRLSFNFLIKAIIPVSVVVESLPKDTSEMK